MIFGGIFGDFHPLDFLKNLIGSGQPKKELIIPHDGEDVENRPPMGEQGPSENTPPATEKNRPSSNKESMTPRKKKTRSMSARQTVEEPAIKKKRSRPGEDISNGSLSTEISPADSSYKAETSRSVISDRFRATAASQSLQKRTVTKTVTPAEIKASIVEKKEADRVALTSGTKIGEIDGCIEVRAPLEANPQLPDVSSIKKNKIDPNLLTEAKKVNDCDCENGCSSNCPCVIASIAAGRAYLFNGYVQACVSGTKNTGFQWDVVVNACSETCRCRGRCSHGIKSQDLVTTVQLRYISPAVGYGVFATEPILKGKLVFEFIGEVSDDVKDSNYAFKLSTETQDEAMAGFSKYWGVEEKKEKSMKEAEKKKNIFIDPSKFGNIARFVNHAQVTNLCQLRCLVNDQRPGTYRMFFYASKDIIAGSELLIDYGPNYEKVNFGGNCICRHPVCSTSSMLVGYTKQEIIRLLEEEDSMDEKTLAEEGKTFLAVVQSWSPADQDMFAILMRALDARYSYYIVYCKNFEALRKMFIQDYLLKPKPLGWKDPQLKKK